MRRLLLAGLLLAACTTPEIEAPADDDPPAAQATPTPPPTTKATMNEVFDAVAVLLPLSFDDDAWMDPANSDRIVAELGSLSRSIGLLEGHAEGRDVGFGWLAQSLAGDVAVAERAYLKGARRQARHHVQRAVDNCVACHARLPGDAAGEFGMRLFNKLDADKLGPVELTALLQATRQFDAAASNYEEYLGLPASRSEHVVRLASLQDYVSLVVRVQGQPERGKPTLDAILAQEDLPRFLRKDVERWRQDLDAAAPEGDALKAARTLIEDASTRREFPTDRRNLVLFLQAARRLDIATNTEEGARLAEAYYLLGLAEANLDRAPRLGKAEVFLEAAIRQAPRSQFAADALDRLEWYLALEYSGSGGAQLPPELEARLDELRKLARQE